MGHGRRRDRAGPADIAGESTYDPMLAGVVTELVLATVTGRALTLGRDLLGVRAPDRRWATTLRPSSKRAAGSVECMVNREVSR